MSPIEELANARMPEPYLVWFSRQGFPGGKLGELLESALCVRTNGLEGLLRPLRDPDQL